MSSTVDHWVAGEWGQAIWEPYIGTLGEPLLGTVLAGALIMSFYIHSGDIILPSILCLLLGGVLTAILPGHMVMLSRAIIVVALAAGFLAVSRRYILD